MRGGTHTIPESGEGKRSIDALDCGLLAGHPDDRRTGPEEESPRHGPAGYGGYVIGCRVSGVGCRWW